MLMSESASIILTGEVLPGHEKENVISALARMFKTNEPKAALLLAGRETTVRRNVPIAEIARYLQAFAKIGAVARFEAANASSIPPAQSTKPTTIVSPPVESAPERKPISASGLSLAPGWSKPEDNSRKENDTGARGRSTQSAEEIYGRSRASYGSYQSGPAPVVYFSPSVFSLSTEGRIGRLRYMAYYWPTLGLMALFGVLAAVIIPTMGLKTITGGTIAAIALGGILMLWMCLRVMVMRMHDLNLSGKWILLPLVLGGIISVRSPTLAMFGSGLLSLMSFALMVVPGSEEENDYGPPCSPNTTAVYVGAVSFLLVSVLGATGTAKFGNGIGLRPGQSRLPTGTQLDATRDAKLRKVAEDLNAKTPMMLNPDIRLDKVEYTDKVLRYSATVMGRGVSVSDDQKYALKKEMIEAYCKKDAVMQLSREAKVTVEYTYKYLATAWDYDSFTIRLNPDNCN